ncbi:predicted protein [Methanosarcina acetivorans C2A]|uniref:Uncharacterized protein n=1 Tax=Methanosarcina acetivorans (strain ATCC 35395 / DSM 2834 / JCM 12185 / C2A) TaxID=188937 RepID=Q8TLK0_METAC|nr:predicted protein [Methanosarcina acetivorans C2A]
MVYAVRSPISSTSTSYPSSVFGIFSSGRSEESKTLCVTPTKITSFSFFLPVQTPLTLGRSINLTSYFSLTSTMSIYISYDNFLCGIRSINLFRLSTVARYCNNSIVLLFIGPVHIQINRFARSPLKPFITSFR